MKELSKYSLNRIIMMKGTFSAEDWPIYGY
jgi:hypothetical protein